MLELGVELQTPKPLRGLKPEGFVSLYSLILLFLRDFPLHFAASRVALTLDGFRNRETGPPRIDGTATADAAATDFRQMAETIVELPDTPSVRIHYLDTPL